MFLDKLSMIDKRDPAPLPCSSRHLRPGDPTMKLGCSFATSLETPEHIRLAEELGYERALCYDSPALYPDVWVILNQAAERTDRIVLGPGVLIPSLRHPMVTA